LRAVQVVGSGPVGERATPTPRQDPASALLGDEDLGDVEEEACVALVDLVIVVYLTVCGAQLGPGLKIAETFERVIGRERGLGQNQEVGLAGSGVAAVNPAGLSESCGDAIPQMCDLIVVAERRAGDRQDEEELH
jgi:hypothetical protein